MKYIVWFLFSFILIYIIYYLLVIKKSRRDEKMPTEAMYLIALYKLDINKFSYYKFIRVVGFVTCLDIAIVATVIANVEGFIWQILFGFIAVIPIIILSFMVIGKIYQKKQLKDNQVELEKEKKYLEKLDIKKSKKNKRKKKGK